MESASRWRELAWDLGIKSVAAQPGYSEITMCSPDLGNPGMYLTDSVLPASLTRWLFLPSAVAGVLGSFIVTSGFPGKPNFPYGHRVAPDR